MLEILDRAIGEEGYGVTGEVLYSHQVAQRVSRGNIRRGGIPDRVSVDVDARTGISEYSDEGDPVTVGLSGCRKRKGDSTDRITGQCVWAAAVDFIIDAHGWNRRCRLSGHRSHRSRQNVDGTRTGGGSDHVVRDVRRSTREVDAQENVFLPVVVLARLEVRLNPPIWLLLITEGVAVVWLTISGCSMLA